MPSPKTLKRILLVEDEADIQTVARLALEDIGGFEVAVCASGEEAVERGPAFDPQLILLDYMMPGMDGRGTMEAFRSLPPLRVVPVVFLTARAQLDEVEEYHRLGAIEVIVKPFDPMTLAEQVEEIWSRHVRFGGT
ncbi:MAG: response regulator [Acidobacteriota bacterium]